ncbi:MAG: porphobilinogen synthase [Candidatus Kariarchaeaceae archaeon]
MNKMIRQRRLRSSETIRDALAETRVSTSQLVFPLFFIQGNQVKQEIKSMPNIYQISPDLAVNEVTKFRDAGIKSFMLFGIPENKDVQGSGAYDPKGPVPEAIKQLKNQFGKDIVIYSDVCLCEYTSHGHCGIPTEDGVVKNDESLDLLARAALTYAEAGSDWVAPSNMMDNRVSSIRELLDDNGFLNTPILSYSAKFSGAYYGPFRDAAYSAPSFGDRRAYQIDYRNTYQALREIQSDEAQGADATMVKPALPYLDIIVKATQITQLPIYAYNVSGEYSMVKFGAAQGIFDEQKIVLENLTAIKRAGADVIITYHAVEAAQKGWL